MIRLKNSPASSMKRFLTNSFQNQKYPCGHQKIRLLPVSNLKNKGQVN